MEFEWDPVKNARSLRERGLDFAAAIPAFEDARKKIWIDERRDYDETRFNMLANCQGRVVHVTFALRAGVVRIISFRKANMREQTRYEQEEQ
jgi:hypothetical protein